MGMPRHTRECRELEPPAGALGWVSAASCAPEIHLELTVHRSHAKYFHHLLNLTHHFHSVTVLTATVVLHNTHNIMRNMVISSLHTGHASEANGVFTAAMSVHAAVCANTGKQ